jgi:hypothetical protein
VNRREALKALTALPVVARIAVAKMEPDDVLVVECDTHISQEHAARIREKMGQIWPGRKVAVFGAGTRLKIASGSTT